MSIQRNPAARRFRDKAKAHTVSIVSLTFAFSALAPDLAAQCTPHWSDSFATAAGGIGRDVYALASGTTALGAPVMYAAGSFAANNHVATWDVASWSQLGTGLDDEVRALTVFDDDGAGPNPSLLYAGGAFMTAGGASANRLAVWDGSTWSSPSSGMTGPGVYALAVFDDDDGGPNSGRISRILS